MYLVMKERTPRGHCSAECVDDIIIELPKGFKGMSFDKYCTQLWILYICSINQFPNITATTLPTTRLIYHA